MSRPQQKEFKVVSCSSMETVPSGSFHWHTHSAQDELCLVLNDSTTIGHSGVETQASSGSLYLFRQGERHGYWNSGGQSPHLWIIHYKTCESALVNLPTLISEDAAKRIWRLNDEQVSGAKRFFMRIMLEMARSTPVGEFMSAALLQQFLGFLYTVGKETEDVALPLEDADEETINLWQEVVALSMQAADERLTVLEDIPGYDSRRHRFTRRLGISPVKLFRSLQMNRAKAMMLESDMSIKEIAEVLGYARQHEFSRAFKNTVGVSPTSWRDGAML